MVALVGGQRRNLPAARLAAGARPCSRLYAGRSAELLALAEGRDCDEARRLASAKLAAVRQRLTHLRRIERVLSEQVRACAASGGRQRCPLIDTLAHNEPRDNRRTSLPR